MPALAGVHHLKLPVTDLARSREWYRSRLGYQVQVEFVEQGQLMGYALAHPNGGPPLGLRLDPGRARAAAGFDYFAIGVPGKEAIDQLAARLDALGEQHAGVHWASIGWILPHLHDPDGHEIRFYTLQHHTEPAPGQVTTIHDPRETAGLREQAATRRQDGPPAGELEEKRCLRPRSGNCRKPPSPARTASSRSAVTAATSSSAVSSRHLCMMPRLARQLSDEDAVGVRPRPAVGHDPSVSEVRSLLSHRGGCPHSVRRSWLASVPHC